MFYTRSRYPSSFTLLLPSVPSIRRLQFPFLFVLFCLILFDAFLSDIGIGSGSGVWRGGGKAWGKSNWKIRIPFSGLVLVWIGLDWIGVIFIFTWLDA